MAGYAGRVVQHGTVVSSHLARTVRLGVLARSHSRQATLPPLVGSPPDVPSDLKVTVIRKENLEETIPLKYRDNVFGAFLRAYNGMSPAYPYDKDMASLAVVACMDRRKKVAPAQGLPFYLVRVPGANVMGSEYQVAIPLSVGVKSILVLTHTGCLMSRPNETAFVKGMLTQMGWGEERSRAYFNEFVGSRGIGDPYEFAVLQAEHLQRYFDPEGKHSIRVGAFTMLTEYRHRPIVEVERNS